MKCVHIKWVLFSNAFVFISDVSFPCCVDILNLNADVPAFSEFFSLPSVLSLLHVCSGLRKCIIYYLDSAFQKCQNEIWMFAYYTSIYIGVRYVLKSSETFVFVWKSYQVSQMSRHPSRHCFLSLDENVTSSSCGTEVAIRWFTWPGLGVRGLDSAGSTGRCECARRALRCFAHAAVEAKGGRALNNEEPRCILSGHSWEWRRRLSYNWICLLTFA